MQSVPTEFQPKSRRVIKSVYSPFFVLQLGFGIFGVMDKK